MSDLVLIIDPDRDQLTSLKVALEEDGYSVTVAGDGLEGFEKFREVQPNVVITELMMGRISGFELSSRIAANEGFRAPVIFYTGFYRDERARKEVVSKYGASDYFVKPFQIQALKRAVAQCLGKEGTRNPRPSPVQPGPRRPLSDMVLRESQMKTEPDIEAGVQHAQEKAMELTGASLFPEPSVEVSSSPDSPSVNSPAEQNDEALAELPISQDTHPLPEIAPVQPAQAAFAQESVEPDLSAETVDRSPIEDSFVPPVWQSPSPITPFYRSTSFRILAAVILLAVAFVIFRNSGSVQNQKRNVRTVQDAQTPPATAPLSQFAAKSEQAGNGSVPGPRSEPALGNSSPPATPLPAEPKGVTSADRRRTPAVSSSQAHPDVSNPQPRPNEGSPATQSSGPNLVMSDVTGETGPPYLRKSKQPNIVLDKVQARRSTPLVVRVVISQAGKVVEAEPLNQNESNASLSRAAVAAIQNWEFSPVRGKADKNWIRYFSFKITNASQ
jgi:DNA-binding response OmpR family regulator